MMSNLSQISNSFELDSNFEINQVKEEIENPFSNFIIRQNFIKKVYFIFSIQQFVSLCFVLAFIKM